MSNEYRKSMFHELEAACEEISTMTAAVLAASALVPTLSSERAKEFREGVRRIARALRTTADTMERIADEASERRPS